MPPLSPQRQRAPPLLEPTLSWAAPSDLPCQTSGAGLSSWAAPAAALQWLPADLGGPAAAAPMGGMPLARTSSTASCMCLSACGEAALPELARQDSLTAAVSWHEAFTVSWLGGWVGLRGHKAGGELVGWLGRVKRTQS